MGEPLYRIRSYFSGGTGRQRVRRSDGEGILPWRVLFVSRPQGTRRSVVNEEDASRILIQFAKQGRARVAHAKFAQAPQVEQPLSLAAQLSLAALTDVIVGPHGAGLAWAAFLADGRVLVEIMPRMRVLHTQLCNGPAWDATPMYAYGGLSLVVGVRHVCLVGAPLEGADDGL